MKNSPKIEDKEMQEFTFNLGRRMATLRSEMHYSLKDAVAQMQLNGIDITEKTLSHYECATSKIDVFKLSKVARFYSVTTDYLLYGTEPTPDNQINELVNRVPKKLQPHIISMVKKIVEEINSYFTEK